MTLKHFFIISAIGIWALVGIAGYHVFIDHALTVMYVCATPENHLADPGPPPGVASPHSKPEMPVPKPEPPK
jgi:hypothetical protein